MIVNFVKRTILKIKFTSTPHTLPFITSLVHACFVQFHLFENIAPTHIHHSCNFPLMRVILCSSVFSRIYCLQLTACTRIFMLFCMPCMRHAIRRKTYFFSQCYTYAKDSQNKMYRSSVEY